MTTRAHPEIRTVTTATFIRLIFFKDLHRTRLFLALMLGLAATSVLAGHFGQPSTGFPFQLFLMAGALAVIILLFLEDPVGRDFRFLGTRPIPALAVFLAKALFLTLFLIVPFYALRELELACLGVPLGGWDHLLLFIETTTSASYLIALVTFACLFFRRRPREIFTALVLCGIVLTIEFWGVSHKIHFLYATGTEEEIWRSDFTEMLFKWGVIAAILVTALVRYRTKRYWLPLGLAIAGTALSSLVFCLPLQSSLDLYLRFIARAPLTAEQLSHVAITLPEVTQSPRWNQHWNVNQDGSKYLVRVITVQGVQAPYFAYPVAAHTVATLPSGQTLAFDSVSSAGPTHRQLPPQTSIPDFQMANVAQATTPTGQPQLEVALFRWFSSQVSSADLTDVRLQGTITLRICRALQVGATPLKTGQTLLAPRRLCTITDAYFARDYVQFGFDRLHVPLILRGDAVSGFYNLDPGVIVVYRPFHEALQSSSGGTSGIQSDALVQEMHFNATWNTGFGPHGPDWKSLPPDWASGTELVFAESEPCGEVTLPYQLDHVDLQP